jgi:hypothetical protein
MPNTTNGGVEVAASVAATDVRVSATVTIVRDVAVAPSKTGSCGRIRVIRIVAVTVAAIVRRKRQRAAPAGLTALPAAPTGFGRNSQ